MKAIGLASFFSFLYLFTHSQLIFSKQWDKRYGGVNDDGMIAIQKTIDGGACWGDLLILV